MFPLVRPGQEWDNQRVQFPPRLRGITAASALVLVAGCTAAPDTERSAVGVAARSDGSVVLVTAWCMAARTEDPQVHSYRVDGVNSGPVELLYRASGSSQDPVTVHQVGQANQGFEAVTNQPLPASGLLIAYNAGSVRSGLGSRAFPSSAALFTLSDLPVSDDPLPQQVVTGARHRVPLQQLIQGKCVDPETGQGPR